MEDTQSLYEDDLLSSSDASDSTGISDNEGVQEVISEELYVSDEQPMPLPPEATFPTLQELEDSVHAWTLQYGYELVNTSSQKKGTHGQKKTVRCGRAGKTKNCRKLDHTTRVRKTSSHKSGCKVSVLYVTDDKEQGPWSIQHPRQPASHNHLPTKAEALPNYRRSKRTAELVSVVKAHLSAGIPTRQSLAVLCTEFPDSFQTCRDLYNIKREHRRIIQQSVGIVEAAIHRLQAENFYTEYGINEQRELDFLFLSHPDSIKMLRQFNDVILLDCTYKTNRYNRPLLNICGVTGSNHTINVALCFLPGEREEHFVWALRQLDKLLRSERINAPKLFVSDRDQACLHALSTVFPLSKQRLCMWHLKKDVLQQTRSYLGMRPDPDKPEQMINTEATDNFCQLWEQAIHAKNQAEFEKVCSSLRTSWLEGWKYLERQWLPFADLFLDFKVDQSLHFGIQSTSRVEGNHAQLKKWLQNSRCDILGFIERLLPWWAERSKAVQQFVWNEEQQALIMTENKLYQSVQRSIWRYALLMCEKRYQLALKEIELITRLKRQGKESEISKEVCSGVFYKSTGLPCQHTLRDLKLEGKPLQLSHFHQHWHIHPERTEEDYEERPEAILEPSTVARFRRSTQRATQRKNKTGTGPTGNRREDLLSETVVYEAIERNKRPVRSKVIPPFITNSQQYQQYFQPQHQLQLQQHQAYPFQPNTQQSQYRQHQQPQYHPQYQQQQYQQSIDPQLYYQASSFQTNDQLPLIQRPHFPNTRIPARQSSYASATSFETPANFY